MANTQQLKFYKVATLPDTGVLGGIYFETSTKTINVYTNTGWEKYAGKLESADWDSAKKVLTLKKYDGSFVELNFSDMASASAIATKLGTFNDDASNTANSSIHARINAAFEAVENAELDKLGTAAYVDTTAFDAAGTGEAQANAVKKEILGYTEDEQIPESDAKTIKGINDRIDLVAGNAKFYSIAAVTGDELDGLGANVKEAYKLVDEDSERAGEYIKIYKDSALQGVDLEGQELVFTYLLADGSEEEVRVDVSNFLAESEFKDGLQVVNHVVSVKVDAQSESFLTVSANGVKLAGVQNAIDTAKNTILGTLEESDATTLKAINEEIDAIQDTLDNLDNQITEGLSWAIFE